MSTHKKSKNLDNDDICFKIITLGNTGVGKSSIIKRFISDKFEPKTISTIGFGTFNKVIELKDGTKVKLNLIDTAGQENYKALSTSYLKNADGVLFVFANDDRKSFEDIIGWIQNYKDACNNLDFSKHLPAYLIENKIDLEGGIIEKEEIEKIKNEYNIFGYAEVSSKNGQNINEMFLDMGEMLIQIYGKKEKKQNLKLVKRPRKKKKFCQICPTDEK